MGQTTVYNSYNYGDYTERIRYLRSTGDQLLQRIELLKTSINKRKQQNQQPNQNEITSLHAMATKLLQMLAEINVCQYFKMVNEYYYFNEYYYKQMCFKYFEDLMQQFNLKLKLKAKRLNRNLIDDVDFLISR